MNKPVLEYTAIHDLYEALKAVVNMHAMKDADGNVYYVDRTGAMKQAREALKRARGDDQTKG